MKASFHPDILYYPGTAPGLRVLHNHFGKLLASLHLTIFYLSIAVTFLS